MPPEVPGTRRDCELLDRSDPLAAYRELFSLEPGTIYLDGNSLGAMPRSAVTRVAEMLSTEWGHGAVRSWNSAGWLDASRRLGDKVGRLIGARPGEVVVCDSTSVNLFKLLVAALRYQAGRSRSVLLTHDGNFPTDLYVADEVVRVAGGSAAVRRVPPQDLAGSMGPDVAVLLVTHVDYRTGYMHDLAGLTAAAHAQGALALWDLCHSAGAVPVDLGAAGADLAVGCTYKFLNGGPGAPAYLYAASRLQAELSSPIAGWFGHASTFSFEDSYEAAPGVERFLAGTPPIVSLAALEAALDLWQGVDIEAVRGKSMALAALVVGRADDRLAPHGVRVFSPREAAQRGSQVSLGHPSAYQLTRALAERGVVCDFRPPDILRVGLTPLYTGFVDVWDAMEIVEEVLEQRSYEDERFGVRLRVP
jgi:kynureninase